MPGRPTSRPTVRVEAMRRGSLVTACLLALPAAADETPSQAPVDAEFLEFLAETAGEDEEFVEYVESRQFERELKRVEKEREATKDEDDEDR